MPLSATPAEWTKFYGLMHRKTGLDLNLYKPDQMQRRILSMLESRKIANLDQFWAVIGATDEEMRWFLDRMAINVSELYRNPEKWEELRCRVLPELTSKTSRLKVWSAGCSFGAEAHTLSVLFDTEFPGSHTILGTDIDESALDQARRGEFGEMDMKGVPAQYKSKYFDYDAAKRLYTAKPALKRYLSFKKGNLLADRFDSGYDLILCRNVVIYFTDEAKADLYRRFYRALKPGGVLFVGGTERIYEADVIGFESPLPFFYRKPLEANRWQNAS